MAFNDLREFIQAARALKDVQEIHGAHWDLEIGAPVSALSPELRKKIEEKWKSVLG